MDFCIYRVNSTGELNADSLSKFPGGAREFYTVLECGYKTREEAYRRIDEMKKEEGKKKKA